MSVLSSLPAISPDRLSMGNVSLTALADLRVLQAAGADAQAFLQGQLTQDIKALGTVEARLAGYCTAKGRLLASGVIWKAHVTDPAQPAYDLMVDAGVAEAFAKRLSMFVLRAKVKIAPTPAQVTGVQVSEAGRAALTAVVGALPHAPWVRVDLPSGTWIAAPQSAADTGARWWWIAEEQQLAATVALLGASAALGDPVEWQRADVAAGLPWVTAATQDMFVPQTVNLELIGGVSFTKGCYPGQEVVARSHYLGKSKRRMHVGQAALHPIPATPLEGSDVFHSQDPAQPCGRVVNAVRVGDVAHVLFETTFASLESGTLHLVDANGPTLTPGTLPYSLTPAP